MSSASGAASSVAVDRRKPAWPRKWEQADTVVAFGSLLVATIVAIFVLLCFQGYDTTVNEAKARAQRAAAIVAEGVEWILAATKAPLEYAAQQPEDGAAVDLRTAFGNATRAASAQPGGARLAVYDAQGTLQPGLHWEGAPGSIADQDDFRRLAAGGLYELSAQEGTGDQATFSVSRRLGTRDFAGVVRATLPATVLSEFSIPQNLGPNSTVSVIRLDGPIVARNPSLSRPTNLSGTDAMRKIAEAPSGAYVSEASPVDGIARIVGFQHVDGFDAVAVASISTTEALGGLWYSIWVVSLLLAPFALAVLFGSVMTARALRKAQASSRSLGAALEHNEHLFKEIHHRVKNNLQSVNSLLQLHPIPPAIRAEFARRIFAMSAVHEHIYTSGNFSDVRVRDYLHTLIENIRGQAGTNISVEEDLEDVVVDKDAAAPLGLILNEVLSNSFKHAFPDGKPGVVRVSLKQTVDKRVQLSVTDNGVGFDPAVAGKGIGRKLIAGFAQQLGGEVTVAAENGSIFVLLF
ncbi:sensor histidine kinase [Devosia sp. CN2-171]|uniref:sensor histidine kinase n=1 Tax=Devosia sp. CN2-171 TaxID=3400909 RepID=UPI003BF8C24E